MRASDARTSWAWSEFSGDLVEGGRDAEVAVSGVDAEFVVAAAQVLDEGVTSNAGRHADLDVWPECGHAFVNAMPKTGAAVRARMQQWLAGMLGA